MIRSSRRALLLALFCIPAISSCRAPTAADERETYVLAFLVRGTTAAERTPEERNSIQAAHLANIGRLAAEKKLVIAGPFGKPVPDEALRGVFVFDTREIETARAWTNTDPAVQAGVLGMELATIRTATPLRRALELYQATLVPGSPGAESTDKMRGYVMLIASEEARAERGLRPLRQRGQVVFEGRLGASARGNLLAVLDAQDVDAARTLFGREMSELGDHSLASWFAMGSLAELTSRASYP